MAIPPQTFQGLLFHPTPTREDMGRVGWGIRRSMTVATSKRRKTPRTKGKWATGCPAAARASAIMSLLSLLNSAHHREHHSGA